MSFLHTVFFCHGQTGAVKDAAKATGSTFLVPGKPKLMQNTLVEWLILANLNPRPFGSGAWYIVKQYLFAAMARQSFSPLGRVPNGCARF